MSMVQVTIERADYVALCERAKREGKSVGELAAGFVASGLKKPKLRVTPKPQAKEENK